MSRVGFHRMPWTVVVGTGLTLFQSWVLFGELVLDRYGFWRFLPFYRKGDVCVYEPAVATLIVVGLGWLTRRGRLRNHLGLGSDRAEPQ